MKVIAALWCAIAVHAAPDDDPIAVLMRVRDKILEHAERVPNHTCVETISRDWYAQAVTTPPRSCDDLLGRRKRAGVGTLVKLTTTDRLRLDVAIADGHEIFSWAGAARFEDREIDEIVPPGAISTGPFAAMLLGIFQIRDPMFAFEGETTQEGRRLMEYSFTVPEEESHSKVKAGKTWLITGYTGTLVVDPLTAELVRLTVRTEELPKATNICEVDSTLEYGLVHLGAEEYLLPKLTRERYIEQNGSEAENDITFSACREFRGESTVSFGGHPDVATKVETATPALKLPAGLPVSIDMTSVLSDESAAGDRIEGRVAQPIRDALQRVFVAAGARAEGRLMRVETLHGKPGDVTIALQWETLEVDGVKIPVQLTPDRQKGNQRFPSSEPRQRRAVEFVLPRPGEENYAQFKFTGEHLVVRDPLSTMWFTLPQ